MKDKELIWRRHIEKQSNSTHTIQVYCEQHRLTEGMFYYWKRKLAKTTDALSFKELQIIEPSHKRGVIHVRFPSGVELWLDGDTDPLFLKTLAGLVVSEQGMRQAVEPC